jgi:hypothetical protein
LKRPGPTRELYARPRSLSAPFSTTEPHAQVAQQFRQLSDIRRDPPRLVCA